MKTIGTYLLASTRSTSGQMLITPALILIILVAALAPPIVRWTSDEMRWTVKTTQNTRSLEMAELGIDLGVGRLLQSSTTWRSVMNGVVQPGFHFDQVYSDVGIGTYAVKISSGPGLEQATVLAVGRDRAQREIWAIRQVLQNTMATTAMYGMKGLQLQNNAQVEWGPVVAYGPITTDMSHAYPRFLGDGAVGPMDLVATMPNTDGVQWWSYANNLPIQPQIDLDNYLADAKAQGAGHFNSGGAPYTPALGATTGVYYYDGDVILDPTQPLFIDGALIIRGNLTLLGSAGLGTVTRPVPADAWREYGHAWNYYRSNWETGAPGSFPGQDTPYVPSGMASHTVTGVITRGFVYVEKQIILNDAVGASYPFVGSLYVGLNSVLNPSNASFRLFFDPDRAAQTKTRNVPLTRIRWETISTCSWTGTYPVCP